MVADILTKGIGSEKFDKLRKMCGMSELVSIEKECGKRSLST